MGDTPDLVIHVAHEIERNHRGDGDDQRHAGGDREYLITNGYAHERFNSCPLVGPRAGFATVP